MKADTPRWIAVLAYTTLRLLIFAAVWAVLQFLTPLRGLWSITLAILVSGAISMFALSKQRDAVSIGVSRFFGGLNARIDASTRAEDDENESEPLDETASLDESEPSAEDEAVAKNE
jgi:hypothetical protein